MITSIDDTVSTRDDALGGFLDEIEQAVQENGTLLRFMWAAGLLSGVRERLRTLEHYKRWGRISDYVMRRLAEMLIDDDEMSQARFMPAPKPDAAKESQSGYAV